MIHIMARVTLAIAEIELIRGSTPRQSTRKIYDVNYQISVLQWVAFCVKVRWWYTPTRVQYVQTITLQGVYLNNLQYTILTVSALAV